METAANRRVTFRRIRGRIVAIKPSDKSRNKIEVGAIAGGSALAADAARTRRIYSSGDLRIDRKSPAFLPLSGRFGDHLVLTKLGKKVGTASHFNATVNGERVGTFSWLGVKEKFRGEGHSKILSKVAAQEMKRKGATHSINHVVHKNSLMANLRKSHDTFQKEFANGRIKSISLSEAKRGIAYGEKKKLFGAHQFYINRKTSLKGLRTATGISPHLTSAGKTRIAVGISLAALGMFSALKRRLEKK